MQSNILLYIIRENLSLKKIDGGEGLGAKLRFVSLFLHVSKETIWKAKHNKKKRKLH